MAILAILMLAQWVGRHRSIIRGRPQGFPGWVRDTPGTEPFGVSRACVNTPLARYDPSELPEILDRVVDLGADWVRQPMEWSEIQPEPDVWNWAPWDAIVTEALARNLRILPVLGNPPVWVGSPPDPQAFGVFAEAVAERYGDAITYYQIWHNPNLGDSWDGRADAYGYSALLARAAERIRAVDPDARIVLGSLAPTTERGDRNYSEVLFLKMLYAAGAGDAFDVVSVQPYGFENGPEDRRVDPSVLNFSRAILVREALVERGDGMKAVWSSDFGWNSKPQDWPGPDSIWGSVDSDTQAQYTVGALARVEREWPWMGLMCVNGLHPREEPGAASGVPDAEAHWGFALIGPDGNPREVYAALQTWYGREPVAGTGAYRADTPLADFKGAWTLGPQGADIGQTGDQVSLPFIGTGVAVTVRRGPYRAFLFVEVDGEPTAALPRDREGHSYVVLYDPLADEVTVPLAEDLPYGYHTLTLTAERGWGQWALADWRIATRVSSGEFWVGSVGLGILVVVGIAMVFWAGPRELYRVLRRLMMRIWSPLSAGARALISVAVTALMLLGAWQSLMSDTVFRRLGEHGEVVALLLSAGLVYFSPWFVLALGAGGVMALMVFAEPSLGLALTALAAPLYLHPLSLLGKSFSLAELVLLPTLVGWFLRMRVPSVKPGTAKRACRVLRDEFLGPVGAWVLIALLSTLGAEHMREAFRELRLVIIEPVLLYAMVRTLPMTHRERWRVIDAWVLSGVMVAGIGLVQYFLLGDVITAEGGIRRLRSLYGSPNNVGLYLGRLLPVLVAVALSVRPEAMAGREWRERLRLWGASTRRLLYAVAVLPLGLALLLSLSRGALLFGVPGAFLVMALLAGRRWRRLALGALVLGAILMVPLLRTPRFAGMSDLTQGTTGFRLALWHSAVEMIRDHPILGVGPDNFLYAYRTRYVLPTAWEEFNLSHPHNVIMDFASRLGLLGLGAFLWHQARFWRRAWSLRKLNTPGYRALALGLIGSMVDFLAHGLVDASYFVIDLALVYFLTAGLVDWLYDAELQDRPGAASAPD